MCRVRHGFEERDAGVQSGEWVCRVRHRCAEWGTVCRVNMGVESVQSKIWACRVRHESSKSDMGLESEA